ncbi:MAG: hypothetical protein QNJ68_18005 [Microcoleaceae cyanobacterium MO_207.B10]|nr:hypothetical protein [Microcoleaceae cyanobacterium MO_207.B10]
MPNTNINLVTLMIKGISLVATGVSCSLFSLPATAAINFGRSTGVFEAANFWYNPVERSTSILAFDEEQNVSMSNDTLQV